jgi:glutamine synthetase
VSLGWNNRHSFSEYPVWNYDGSSTGQARGLESDTYLQPVAVYQDPFLGPNARLVMCDTYNHCKEPTKTNHRVECARVMKECASHRPWFGMEQEYLLLDRDGYPLGWPKHGYPGPQGESIIC